VSQARRKRFNTQTVPPHADVSSEAFHPASSMLSKLTLRRLRPASLATATFYLRQINRIVQQIVVLVSA